MIDEDARLRIENKLLRDIEWGTITLEHTDTELGVFSEVKSTGSFGALATFIYPSMERREGLFDRLYDKTIRSYGDCAYVIEHFLVYLPNIAEGVPVERDMIEAISKRLWRHYHDYMASTQTALDTFTDSGPDEWTKVFRKDQEKFGDLPF